jgi:membrane-bound metal-dependent hydrolase YbcI (DUF457 family)
MTIYEHAMIGVNGALALGLQRRHGWQIVAWAGVAATLPDLDGLAILFGLQCYAEGHRLWGHNLLVAGLVAAIASAAAYLTDAPTQSRQWLAKRFQAFAIQSHSTESPKRNGRELGLWLVVGVLAAYSHLLMDVAFSIGKGLPIWGVPLLWPFSDKAFAYPLLPWGDIGATLILAVSMFAMIRWPTRIRLIAAASLVAVAVYMIVRGLFG